MKDSIQKFMGDFKNRIPGADIYLVGGAVRDSIMGIVPKDYDFTNFG